MLALTRMKHLIRCLCHNLGVMNAQSRAHIVKSQFIAMDYHQSRYYKIHVPWSAWSYTPCVSYKLQLIQGPGRRGNDGGAVGRVMKPVAGSRPTSPGLYTILMYLVREDDLMTNASCISCLPEQRIAYWDAALEPTQVASEGAKGGLKMKNWAVTL